MSCSVHEVTSLDDDLARRLVDLWDAVNVDGGAVGFRPGSHRAEVTERVAGYAARMAAGERVAVLVRDGEDLVATAFFDPGPAPLLGHTADVVTVMTDPARRSQGLGRLVMAGLEEAALARGITVLTLDYRDGTGAGDFYAACGWVETGRVPGLLAVADDDVRASVAMARRTDGRPLA